ncbi:MAG: methyltransferase domain-containing protein [Armatimonadetes bacterium]|nr:methyltransferase domain-containing protein [Armatimonadota bacterium]
MKNRDPEPYVLGTDSSELRRLALQHSLWREQAVSLWDRSGFGRGDTILDVGCGPGYASVDLAERVGPDGRVIALDESPRFISHLTGRGVANVEASVADVQRLSLPAGIADGAYARWVLCYVEDPEAVVAGVANALRAGGAFAVQDYFNYRAIALAPKSDLIDRVIAAVEESFRMRGGDSDVAARVPGMMLRHGLRVKEITPIIRVAVKGDELWQWPITFFRNYLPSLVSIGLLNAAQSEEFLEELVARSEDPAGFFSTPPMYDIIGVRE